MKEEWCYNTEDKQHALDLAITADCRIGPEVKYAPPIRSSSNSSKDRDISKCGLFPSASPLAEKTVIMRCTDADFAADLSCWSTKTAVAGAPFPLAVYNLRKRKYTLYVSSRPFTTLQVRDATNRRTCLVCELCPSSRQCIGTLLNTCNMYQTCTLSQALKRSV